MHLIWTILIGFVVDLLARFLMPGDDKMGINLTTVLGVTGSLVATYAGQQSVGTPQGKLRGVASLVGAVALLLGYNLVGRKSA